MTKEQTEALSNAEAFLLHLKKLLTEELSANLKTAGNPVKTMELSIQLGALEATLAALDTVG